MCVFSEEWRETLRRKYAGRPEYQWPPLYRFATGESYSGDRADVERWVAAVPLPGREVLTRRLREPDQFLHTYNEILCAGELMDLGYFVEYEKAICGVTPDWYVSPKGDCPAFVVEVLTAQRSDEEGALERQKDELWGMLQRIPLGFFLQVDFGRVNWSSKQWPNRNTTAEVRRWLQQQDPPVGATLSVNGIAFHVLRRDMGRGSVALLGGWGFSWVDTAPLLRKVEQKVEKYEGTVREVGIPLVVALMVGLRWTLFTVRTFADALLGHGPLLVTYEDTAERIVHTTRSRTRNGLFSGAARALSAAVWLAKEPGTASSFIALHNPFAVRPLPAGAFGSADAGTAQAEAASGDAEREDEAGQAGRGDGQGD